MPYVGQTITDVFPTSVSLDTVTTTNLTATNATASTSLKTPLVEFTDGDDAIAIADTGVVTMPNQPAFAARITSTQSNISTSYSTVTFDSEIFDQNSDFNTSNYTFTAPVTGRYMFSVSVAMVALPLNAQWFIVNVTTSNRSYIQSTSTDQFDAGTDSSHATSFSLCTLADMDASDTAYVRVYQYTGTVQADIGDNYSYFTGHLVC